MKTLLRAKERFTLFVLSRLFQGGFSGLVLHNLFMQN